MAGIKRRLGSLLGPRGTPGGLVVDNEARQRAEAAAASAVQLHGQVAHIAQGVSGAIGTAVDYDARLTSVESMAGLSPGEVTDGQTSSLVGQHSTWTRREVNGAVNQLVTRIWEDPANEGYFVSTYPAYDPGPDKEYVSDVFQSAAAPVPLIMDEEFVAPAVGVHWMGKDGKLLLRVTSNFLRVSYDEGATWVEDPKVFQEPITAVRQMDNGELVVGVGTRLSHGAWVYVSTGWADNPATATWDLRITATHSECWFVNEWAMDTYGPYVLVNEYGPKSAGGNANKVWLSEDYGQTFTVVYNNGNEENSHIHGCALDRYTDGIWIVTGDGKTTKVLYGPRNGPIEIFSENEWQHVCVFPMEKAVLFGSDRAPNGIGRTIRLPDGRFSPMEVAALVDNEPQLTMLGSLPYRRSENDPLLFPFRAAVGARSPGRIFATWDGLTVTEIWRDYDNSPGSGVTGAFGPTASGRILARVNGTARGEVAELRADFPT